MKTEKPEKLIALLKQLVTETDKMNIGQIYIAVVQETKRINFVEGQNTHSNLVYKHLIQLSIKDFIHSGRSEASRLVIEDVMEVISGAGIVG